MKKQIPTGFSIISRINSKKLLILMGVVIVSILIDSEIGLVADFIPEQLSSSTGVAAFIGIAITFAITQYFNFSYIKECNSETQARALNLDLTYWIVSIAQYVLVGTLAFVILQIIIVQQYSTVTLYASHVISYGLWIVILASPYILNKTWRNVGFFSQQAREQRLAKMKEDMSNLFTFFLFLLFSCFPYRSIWC